MNVLYIVNMKEDNTGGLFKATYERIIRHNNEVTSYIENINYYDSSAISLLKERLLKKNALKISSLNYNYGQLKIHNLNFIRGLKYYFNKLFNLEKRNLEDMLGVFIEKNNKKIAEADIIHAHWAYPNGYLAYRISQEYNIPYFITLHGNDLNNIRKKEVVFLLEAMENAEKCFFVSKQLLKNAMKQGYSGLNSEITYNGVDIERFKLSDKTIQKNKVVGYIGALESVKGVDLLPEMFAAIEKKYAGKVNFIIIGDGTLKNRMQDELAQNKLSVKFTGSLGFDEIPEKLARIDLLVVPSRNEGLGMVILEANAMGIPAVGTSVGGIPEAIGYDENLIEPDQELIENMATRIASILKSETDDSKKYRNRVIDKFLWKDIIEIDQLLLSKINIFYFFI